MIQVHKEAFKARAFNVASALKALINVYHTLFFIITALQSENYNKKSKLKYLFRINLCHYSLVNWLLFRCYHKLRINVYLSLFKM
jgi:hypothetical protein